MDNMIETWAGWCIKHNLSHREFVAGNALLLEESDDGCEPQQEYWARVGIQALERAVS